MDENYAEFNPLANISDSSCVNIVVIGCMNSGYLEYNEMANVSDFTQCSNKIILGCTDSIACNYNEQANIDDENCLYPPEGYNCDNMLGCTDSLACNYNPLATETSECVFNEEGYDCDGNLTITIGDEAYGGIVFYVDYENDLAIVISPENLGSYPFGCYSDYIPGVQYSGIGFGKLNTVSIDSWCGESPIAAKICLEYENEGYDDWYLPSIGELLEMHNNIGVGSSIMENYGDLGLSYGYNSSTEIDGYNNAALSSSVGQFNNNNKNTYMQIRAVRYIGDWIAGCMDSLACNFNSEANMADGSCTYAEQGYDCGGNFTGYLVGMETEGGIVFYVDETGQHGLVAAMEDLEGTYSWGCYGIEVNGADGTSIGTGYQNTMDIVNQECLAENGGIIAAQATIDAIINGYNDWYLPSIEELVEIDIAVGPHSELNNLANLNINTSDNFVYWSSTERISNSSHAFILYPDGHSDWTGKWGGFLVRPIRSF